VVAQQQKLELIDRKYSQASSKSGISFEEHALVKHISYFMKKS
jgi:hypothetical protein